MKPTIVKNVSSPSNCSELVIDFPKLPNLFLNFLENKNKLKSIYKNVPKPEQKPEQKSHESIKRPSPIKSIVQSESDRRKLFSYETSIVRDNIKIRSITSQRNEQPKPEPRESSAIRPIKNHIDKIKENIKDDLKIQLDDNPLQNKDDRERELQKKQDIMYKFSMLKRQFPRAEIPNFTVESDYQHMRQTYNLISRQLNINTSIDAYKSYMAMGFSGCELFLSKMGFDMDGFAQQQISALENYEPLLIEIGEKTYMPYDMNQWPVEVRLTSMVLFNAVWFIIAKTIAKRTNVDIIKLMNEQKTKIQHTVSDSNIDQMKKPINIAL